MNQNLKFWYHSTCQTFINCLKMFNIGVRNACEEKACEVFHRNIEIDKIKIVWSKIKNNLSFDVLVIPSDVFTFYGLPELQWYT